MPETRRGDNYQSLSRWKRARSNFARFLLRPALLAAIPLLLLYPLASWLHKLPETYRASHDGSGQPGRLLISSRTCSKYGCVLRGTFTGTDGAVRTNVKYRDEAPAGINVGDTLPGRYIPKYGVLATGDSTLWQHGGYLAIISTSFLGMSITLGVRQQIARGKARPRCPVCGAKIVGSTKNVEPQKCPRN